MTDEDPFLLIRHLLNVLFWSILFFFRQISAKLETWDWIEETLLPNLYYTEDYRGQALNAYNEKFLVNTVAMRLGPPRLRQLRNKPRMFIFR